MPEENEQLTREDVRSILKESVPTIAREVGSEMADEIKDNWEESLEQAAKEQEQEDRESRKDYNMPSEIRDAINARPGGEADQDERSPDELFSDVLRAVERGETTRTDKVLREMKQNPEEYDERSIEQMEEAEKASSAQAKGMQASQFDNAGVLLPEPVAEGIIEMMEANTFIRQRIDSVTLENGTLKLHKQNQRASASYQDEAEDFSVSDAKFGQLQLDAKKISGGAVHTREFAQFGGEAAGRIIRNDLGEAIAQRSEDALLRSEGTEARPRGIRHWIDEDKTKFDSPVSSYSNEYQNILATLARQIRTLLDHEVPVDFQNTTFAMNQYTWESLYRVVDPGSGQAVFRDEVESGRIIGFEYDMSTKIPGNLSRSPINGEASELYAIWWPAFLMGRVPGVRLEVSTEAAYRDPATGNLESAFSRDEAIYKAVEYHDLIGRYDFGASVTDVPSDWTG